MPVEYELERTFLVKNLPKGFKNSNFIDIEDNYFPKNSAHANLRIRKEGDRKIMTKKYRKQERDASIMIEETILLSNSEYDFINKLNGKKLLKRRYFFNYEVGQFCEIDVYQDKLKGLVTVDFEFKSIKEKNNFIVPSFCLAEITNECFIAGGVLSGKSFKDIEKNLIIFNYKKIYEKNE